MKPFPIQVCTILDLKSKIFYIAESKIQCSVGDLKTSNVSKDTLGCSLASESQKLGYN